MVCLNIILFTTVQINSSITYSLDLFHSVWIFYEYYPIQYEYFMNIIPHSMNILWILFHSVWIFTWFNAETLSFLKNQINCLLYIRCKHYHSKIPKMTNFLKKMFQLKSLGKEKMCLIVWVYYSPQTTHKPKKKKNQNKQTPFPRSSESLMSSANSYLGTSC